MTKPIGKSKRQLAQLLIEAGVTQFPEGANWAAQDGNGAGFYSGGKPYWDSKYHEWASNAEDGACVGIQILKGGVKNHHQTVLSRDEFDQIVAETDDDGWVEWCGGKQPIEDRTLIDVKFRDGTKMIAAPVGVTPDDFPRHTLDWSHNDRDSDIVAYRLCKPKQDESQCYESVICSIPEPTTTPTLDQLLQDWRDADDYTQRKQAEADEAAAMRDERWQAVQARAGEMGVTVGLCEPVFDESELVITDWRDLLLGDEIELTQPNGGGVSIGEVGTVMRIDSDIMYVNFPSQKGHLISRTNNRWRFVRRP